MTYSPASLDRVASWLLAAHSIAVMTGAGLSKASGIPTYRDEDGLWRNEENVKFSVIDSLHKDPQGFHAFWTARRHEVEQAKPNAAHYALAQLQELNPHTHLITQNIDGLLSAAGCRDVYEIHGNLARSRCDVCCRVNPRATDGMCLDCKHPRRSVRPDVVMFGELLAVGNVWPAAEYAAKRCEVYLSVGTSALVQPAAGLAAKAQTRGAKVVAINLEATPLDRVADALLPGRAEVVLPALVARMCEMRAHQG